MVNTRFLLFIAAVFVVNSHLEAFYPNTSLAGDGLIGYGLFFFVSGLGIALSGMRKARPFGEYYRRRILRIYPTLWLIAIPAEIVRQLHYNSSGLPSFHLSLADCIYKFIWPTENTFVGPLMVCYIILFALLKYRPTTSLVSAILALAVPFAWIWVEMHGYGREICFHPLGAFMWRIGYCQLLLLGAWCGFHLPRSESMTRRRFVLDSTGFLLLLGAYIFVKFNLNGGRFPGLYPSLFFFVAGMLWLLFRVACNPQLARILSAIGPGEYLVNLLGACCLEVYFVHALLISWPPLAATGFPSNVFLLWLMVIPLSYVIERIVGWIRSGCRSFSWSIQPAPGV